MAKLEVPVLTETVLEDAVPVRRWEPEFAAFTAVTLSWPDTERADALPVLALPLNTP